MAPLDTRKFPPVNEGYVRFIASDSSVHDVPEKWLSQAYTIDPDLRLIPGPDADALVLTAEDRAFLWCCGIEATLSAEHYARQ